jgi:hypothetical protein
MARVVAVQAKQNLELSFYNVSRCQNFHQCLVLVDQASPSSLSLLAAKRSYVAYVRCEDLPANFAPNLRLMSQRAVIEVFSVDRAGVILV